MPRSKRAPASSGVIGRLLILLALVACGPDDASSAPGAQGGGDSSAAGIGSDDVAPAEAAEVPAHEAPAVGEGSRETRARTTTAPLDGELKPQERLEQAVAAQIFWRRLREAATELEIASLAAHADAIDPAIANDLEAIVRRRALGSTASSGPRGGAASSAPSLQRVRLEPAERRVRIVALLGESFTHRLDTTVLHPASPPASLDGFHLHAPGAGIERPEAGDAPFGFFRYGDVRFDELERAREIGAAIWVCGEAVENEAVTTPDAAWQEIPGREGRELPIPVIFFDHAVSTGIWRTGLGGALALSIRIERPTTPPQEALVLTMPGTDSTREIVVTCGRAAVAPGFRVGSRALNAAELVEMARVFGVTFFGERARGTLPVTVRFVWALDEGEGWAFLPRVVAKDATLLGVIDLDPRLPVGDRSDVVLVFHGDEAESYVERAALACARAWSGQASAWHTVAVEARPDGLADPAAALGQPRVPAVTLAVAEERAELALRPSSLREIPDAPASWPRARADLGGSGNRVDRVIGAEVPQAVAIARLAALAVVRAAFSAVAGDGSGR